MRESAVDGVDKERAGYGVAVPYTEGCVAGGMIVVEMDENVERHSVGLQRNAGIERTGDIVAGMLYDYEVTMAVLDVEVVVVAE